MPESIQELSLLIASEYPKRFTGGLLGNALIGEEFKLVKAKLELNRALDAVALDETPAGYTRF
jgi:hypothetical protein